MERLVAFSNALTRDPLVGSAGEGQSARGRLLEAVADQAVAQVGSKGRATEGVALQDQICFPMVAGGDIIGMMGVPEGSEPMTDAVRRMMAAAAAIVAVSARNAQLFREISDNSLRDGLTGLFNRAHGREVIEQELRRARRSQQPLAQPNEIDPTALVGRADAALYRAKHDGRNCVRVAADAVLV